MYVRLNKTVVGRGILVKPEEVESKITDRESDWYVSAFTYGEDAMTYWEANKQSIKGFNGKAFTSSLFFDIDADKKFELARANTVKLVEKLIDLGLEAGLEVYFSGSKGFHVIVRTTNEFTPQETSVICYNLAIKDAKLDQTVFDPVVYNITRIFRVVNTKHQKSGFYKIPVSVEELKELDEDAIKALAEKPRFIEFDSIPVDAEGLKAQYAEVNNVIKLNSTAETSVNASSEQSELSRLVAPPGERKCVYALEQGFFGPSERHNAVLRLAAAYKGRGYSQEHAFDLVAEALKNRHERYPDANIPEDSEVSRDILEVYSKEWKGGTFTCKTDTYLQSKCDHGDGPCYDKAESRLKGVVNIDQMFNEYLVYGDQALHEYPKFGINWLDDKVRLRPQNYSVICGSNGSGKTSLILCAMENFNRQKIPHIIFSLDMALPSLMEKIGAKHTTYSTKEIEKAVNAHTRNPEILKEIKEILKTQFPYSYFDFTSSYSLTDIEDRVQTMKSMGIDLQVAIVDYAGRLIAPVTAQGGAVSSYMASTANAMMANDVAKRTKIHMMFIAQVSRENGDHTDPLRSSRVAKESGAWEENATAVINCWRPFGKGLDGNDKYFHLYVAKNRSGALGEHVFKWHGKTGAIEELNPVEFDNYIKLCANKNVEVFVDNFIDSSQVLTVEELEGDRFNSPERGLKFNEEEDHGEQEGLSRSRIGGRPFRRA